VSACYASYNNEYLFLQRLDDGTWGVPSGKVEENETPFNAVIREFREETGITLEENSVFHKKTIYLVDPKKDFFFHVFIIC
jgi:8-oxo-dGTP pyrophosphatase MutT (NUDIX family)